jgi:hypothetical protein
MQSYLTQSHPSFQQIHPQKRRPIAQIPHGCYRIYIMQRTLGSIVFSLTLISFLSFARADSYDTPFSLRFPAALSRFAGYADVAAVSNTSAGSKWATSVNPASTGFLPMTSPWKLGLTPQFSAITFDEGSHVYVVSAAVTWESPNFGTFLPVAAHVFSDTAPTNLDADFKFDAEVYQLQWGIHLNPDLAIGANLNYTRSTVKLSAFGFEAVRTDSEQIDLRTGVLYQFNPRLRAGLVAEYGATLNHNDLLQPSPTGFGILTYHSTTEQVILRPGVSYEYAKDSTIYADYQMVLESDTVDGHADFHRFSAGVDHQLFKGVFVRGGALVDQTGHFSWSTGFAITPFPWLSIDAAYQHDFFPEISQELGHSQTFTISLSASL